MNPAVPLTLLPSLVLVWRAGRTLAGWATGERALARVLAPACALALWLLSVHLIGLASQSFWVGLFAGTTLVAALGLATFFPTRPAEEAGAPLGWPAFVGAAAAVLLMLGMELRYFVWDELFTTGHLSIPLEMLDGIYPPRHLSFAVYELRYHYAFDLLNACVAAVLHQPPMRWVVHGVTLALWGYLALLAWSLGERLVGRGAGAVTEICCLLAGGVPYFCDSPHPFFKLVEGRCFADGLAELPPVPSNFLQHPWSLGLPLGVAALLLFQLRRTRSAGWWIALSALLALLSFSQVVLFGCLSAGLAVAGGFTAPGKRWQQLVLFALWGLSLLLVARLLHGFFAPTPEPAGLHLDFAPFWREPFKQWGLYLGESLGLLLPAGLAGFFVLRRERLALGIAAALGFGVFSLFRYPNSWDIVKFLMVVELALGVSASAAFMAAFRRRWFRWVAAPALAVLASQGVLWLGTAAVGGYDNWYKQSIDQPAAPVADERMIAYLRGQIQPGEEVWRRDTPWAYALLGGLPIQHVDGGTSTFGFSHAVWDARQDLIDHPRDSIDDYERQGIRWFVLGPWDEHLQQKMDRWLKSGRAEARLKEPPLELFYAK